MPKMNRLLLRQKVMEKVRSNHLVSPTLRRLQTSRLIRAGESSEYLWLYRLATPKTRAIDVGANVGLTSSILARRVGAKGDVLALEPNPRIFRQLLAGSKLPIYPLQVAAGAAFGEAILNVPEDSNGVYLGQSGSLLVKSVALKNESHHISVPVITLDSLLIWSRFETSLIKIDVEGFELQVLEGATKTIATYAPALLVEIEEQHQPSTQTIEDVFKKIIDFGYALFAIGPNGPFPVLQFDIEKHQRAHLINPIENCYVNNFIAIHETDRYRTGLIAKSLGN
jgi:FkbM family methyltransferase